MGTAKSVDNARYAARPPSSPPDATVELKPKGACWYCNQPLDNIRRFCSKTCAEDYRTEEESFNGGRY